MEIVADRINVDLERGTVIITGYDLSDIISEIGTEKLLLAMDYADIMQFVTEAEDDTEDSDYHNAMFGR